jgi:ribosome-binding protein aMBF1 (putative translation factor)
MTILFAPVADAFVESLDNGKSTAIARNSSSSSNVCVGSRLRVKRTSRGISQQELSERLGIDREVLNAYEAGAKRVSANLLLRIAKLLGVRPDYFFQGYTEVELEGCLLSLQ